MESKPKRKRRGGSPSTWKKFENRVCVIFSGHRRGAHTGDGRSGMNDCVGTKGFSIEVKNWSSPTFRAMLEDARKAEMRKEKATDIPIAIMKRLGDEDNDALVCIRLETFRKEVLPLLREKQILRELGYDIFN